MLAALQNPAYYPPKGAKLVDLSHLIQQYPHQPIAVFPECTTTNGRGILPFSPSLLTAPPTAKIFPISLRYTASDVTTPIPHTYFTFLWNLLSKPTHCIRVRIAESVFNQRNVGYSDSLREERASSSDTLLGSEDGDGVNTSERRLLDRIGEALARLGRVKRVGLGVKEKDSFVRARSKRRG